MPHPDRKVYRLSLSQIEESLLDHLGICDDFDLGTSVQVKTEIFALGCCEDKQVMLRLEIQPTQNPP